MDDDPGTLITEFARRGDLHSLLDKIGRYIFRDRQRAQRTRRTAAATSPYRVEDDKERTPVVVIWQIFDCRESWLSCFSLSFAALSLSLFLALSYVSRKVIACGWIIDATGPSCYRVHVNDVSAKMASTAKPR